MIGILIWKEELFLKLKLILKILSRFWDNLKYNPISNETSCLILGAMITNNLVLHQYNNTAKEKRNDEDMYYKVGVVKAKSSPSLSPEKLSRIWGISLNT